MLVLRCVLDKYFWINEWTFPQPAWCHSRKNSASGTSLLPRERQFFHCHQLTQFLANMLVLAPGNSTAICSCFSVYVHPSTFSSFSCFLQYEETTTPFFVIYFVFGWGGGDGGDGVDKILKTRLLSSQILHQLLWHFLQWTSVVLFLFREHTHLQHVCKRTRLGNSFHTLSWSPSSYLLVYIHYLWVMCTVTHSFLVNFLPKDL